MRKELKFCACHTKKNPYKVQFLKKKFTNSTYFICVRSKVVSIHFFLRVTKVQLKLLQTQHRIFDIISHKIRETFTHISMQQLVLALCTQQQNLFCTTHSHIAFFLNANNEKCVWTENCSFFFYNFNLFFDVLCV